MAHSGPLEETLLLDAKYRQQGTHTPREPRSVDGSRLIMQGAIAGPMQVQRDARNQTRHQRHCWRGVGIQRQAGLGRMSRIS